MSSQSRCRRPPAAASSCLLITCADDALGVVEQFRTRPTRDEVIALVLDERRGEAVWIVDEVGDPDAVITVVERIAQCLAAQGRPGELVVASVRTDSLPLPGDADRWMEASDVAADLGCELLEWFVVADGTAWCPRDLLAEAPRW